MLNSAASRRLLTNLAALSVLSAASVLFGQTTGSITARVTDPSSAVIPNAKVEVINPEGAVVRYGQTDTLGVVNFSNIPVGTYTLRVYSAGFAANSTTVNVGIAQSTAVEVRLPLGTIPETVEVSSQPQPPVYNAIFEPTVGDNPRHLQANRQTLLRFYIGPENAKNALSIPTWTVNPKILNQKGNVPLTITLTCLPCSGQSIQSKEITFSGQKQASSEARFKFTPQRMPGSPEDGKSKLMIDVMSRGVQFDHLTIDVNIVGPSERSSKREGGSATVGTWSIPTDATSSPDLILTLGRNSSGSTTLEVEPINAALIESFGKLYLSHGQVRSFALGPIADTIMQDAAQRAALTLRAIVDSENQNLQSLLATLPGGIGAVDLVDNIKLSESDRDKVLTALLPVGQVVFRNLFRRADPDLNRLADRLDAFSLTDRRVRILIRTKEVSFPWQLLHNDKNSTITPGDFWGFRYEITVDSLLRRYPGRIPAVLAPQHGSVSVFGGYTAAQGEVPIVSVLSRQQAEFLRSKIPSLQLLSVTSSTGFLQGLRDHSEDVEFLAIYAHGSSGTIILAVNGSLVLEREAAGPRIMFSRTQDVLAPFDLEQLLAGAEDSAFLSRQPIVLLNACDTGTGSISNTTEGLRFPTTLLDLGARGVLATEAPVWAIFAYKFGNDLIDGLSSGEEASKTLVDLRWKYLSEYGNPMGLLYSYYGQPAVRLSALSSALHAN